eukprot:CAMPEP_0204308340 /NCGR_PEP_ID=MMETSP0469-20131031/453_1 /ASSEMBLY_ACC=CAM_ASM_000384 /TAXON_ID=2969 /ORGANISM="Oxyrrhis marina" /LENGTH=258 /DNA_ID=CAMNT_0051287809 /DNA_START=188 /DNA_END=967 /DNA_ORIENTATION=+
MGASVCRPERVLYIREGDTEVYPKGVEACKASDVYGMYLVSTYHKHPGHTRHPTAAGLGAGADAASSVSDSSSVGKQSRHGTGTATVSGGSCASAEGENPSSGTGSEEYSKSTQQTREVHSRFRLASHSASTSCAHPPAAGGTATESSASDSSSRGKSSMHLTGTTASVESCASTVDKNGRRRPWFVTPGTAKHGHGCQLCSYYFHPLKGNMCRNPDRCRFCHHEDHAHGKIYARGTRGGKKAKSKTLPRMPPGLENC